MLDAALEAGAEDVIAHDDGSIDVTTAWEDFGVVKSALQSAGLEPEESEITMIPSTSITLDAAGAATVLALVDMLEDLDDVQNVYTNAEIPAEVFAELD